MLAFLDPDADSESVHCLKCIDASDLLYLNKTSQRQREGCWRSSGPQSWCLIQERRHWKSSLPTAPINFFTQRMNRRGPSYGSEKLGQETQASERKTTQKSSLLTSKFFRTLKNSGVSVDEATSQEMGKTVSKVVFAFTDSYPKQRRWQQSWWIAGPPDWSWR